MWTEVISPWISCFKTWRLLNWQLQALQLLLLWAEQQGVFCSKRLNSLLYSWASFGCLSGRIWSEKSNFIAQSIACLTLLLELILTIKGVHYNMPVVPPMNFRAWPLHITKILFPWPLTMHWSINHALKHLGCMHVSWLYLDYLTSLSLPWLIDLTAGVQSPT